MSVMMVLERVHGRNTACQDIHCPDCGRYLGSATASHLSSPDIRLRLHCRTCGRWKWVDVTPIEGGSTKISRQSSLTKPATPVNNRSNPM